MTKIHLAGLMLLTLVVSCTSVLPSNPQISVLSVVLAGTMDVTIHGKGFNAQSVTIGSSSTTITSSTPNTVTVHLETPLVSGQFRVTVQNYDGVSVTREAALSILPNSGEGIVPGEAFLAFKSGTNRSAVLDAINNAGFMLVGQINEPFITGGTSICAQASAKLKDKTIPPRPSAEALTQLVQELDLLEPNVIFGLNAVTFGNAPAFNGKTQPQTTNKTQTRALPADFANVRAAVLDSGLNSSKYFQIGSSLSFIDSSFARNFTLEDDPTNAVPLETDVSDLAVIDGKVLGHGTAVAGLVASTIRNTFPVGLESAVGLIVPVKVCERDGTNNLCRSSSITLGVCYAASLSGAAASTEIRRPS